MQFVENFLCRLLGHKPIEYMRHTTHGKRATATISYLRCDRCGNAIGSDVAFTKNEPCASPSSPPAA